MLVLIFVARAHTNTHTYTHLYTHTHTHTHLQCHGQVQIINFCYTLAHNIVLFQTSRSALLQQTSPAHSDGMRTRHHGGGVIQPLRHDAPMRRDDSTMVSGWRGDIKDSCLDVVNCLWLAMP